MEEQKISEVGKSLRRRLLKFVGAFFVVMILAYAGLVGIAAYERSQGEKRIQDLANALQKDRDERYAERLADTYGGATPQETLRMYIEAVEKGDFELASKYFVLEKQGEDLQRLQNSLEVNIKNSTILLKQSLQSQGSYNREKTGYAIMRPVLVDFILYPSGIWKILEI